jgi:hypothetical protein
MLFTQSSFQSYCSLSMLPAVPALTMGAPKLIIRLGMRVPRDLNIEFLLTTLGVTGFFRGYLSLCACHDGKVSSIIMSSLPARKNRPGDLSQNTNKFVSNHKFGRLNGRKSLETFQYDTPNVLSMLFKAEDALIRRDRATIDENTPLLLRNRCKSVSL